MSIINSIRRFIAKRRLSIVLDPRDNSITFDPPLVRHMDILSQSQAFIYTFRVRHKVRYWLLPFLTKGYREYYAFSLNPPGIDPESDFVAQVQIDDSTGDIGYECLCPGVSRIAYDLDLPVSTRSRLSVVPHRTSGNDSFTYYRIVPPSSAHSEMHYSSLNEEVLESGFYKSLIQKANEVRFKDMQQLVDETRERMNRGNDKQSNQ